MKKQLNQLIEFHKGFELPWSQSPTLEVDFITSSLRDRLMQEELNEVIECTVYSHVKDNLTQLAKELADLLYTVYGTIITYGLQDHIEEVFDRVHESNMSKLVDGKPVYREDGKVLKGPNYKAPDLSFLNEVPQ